MERRLSLWKGKHLSIGDRIILIKVVLSSLPVYFPSVFKCPVAVFIQKRFLWNDDRDKRKFHLASWSQVCKPMAEGGIGIRPVRPFNIALLGKCFEGWGILIRDYGMIFSARSIGCMYLAGGLLILQGGHLGFGRVFAQFHFIAIFGSVHIPSDDIFF